MFSILTNARRSKKLKQIIFISVLLFALTGMLAVSGSSMPAAAQELFPEIIPLPPGFQPEGIATGNGTNFYVGSIPTGAIYNGDLETGNGDILVEPQDGRSAIGMDFAEGRGVLFVAGGGTGQGYVYHANTGESLAEYELTTDNNVFINDVIVTSQAAYFTNSAQPVLYRVSVDPTGEDYQGAVVEEIELSGDYEHEEGFNINGIDATPDGAWLIAVQTNTGRLYRVDPESGDALEIDLGGEAVINGDGLLLDGTTLYVVQNELNRIAVVELSADLTSGTIVNEITHEAFDIPTTAGEYRGWLYVNNARFNTPPEDDTEYSVVRVEK